MKENAMNEKVTTESILTRLEKWSHGHKSRSVNLESPNGYGAGCWEITLGHERGVTHAAECSFWTLSEDKGGDAEYRRQAEAAGAVFVSGEDDDWEYGWPGLERTIACALDAFDRGVWGPRKSEPIIGQPARARARLIAEAEERGVKALERHEKLEEQLRGTTASCPNPHYVKLLVNGRTVLVFGDFVEVQDEKG